jgi:hypothetical protein
MVVKQARSSLFIAVLLPGIIAGEYQLLKFVSELSSLDPMWALKCVR